MISKWTTARFSGFTLEKRQPFHAAYMPCSTVIWGKSSSAALYIYTIIANSFYLQTQKRIPFLNLAHLIGPQSQYNFFIKSRRTTYIDFASL